MISLKQNRAEAKAVERFNAIYPINTPIEAEIIDGFGRTLPSVSGTTSERAALSQGRATIWIFAGGRRLLVELSKVRVIERLAA